MRKATKNDFFDGSKLVCTYEKTPIIYTIMRKAGIEGVWEARCDGGDVLVFETEASCYWVKQ